MNPSRNCEPHPGQPADVREQAATLMRDAILIDATSPLLRDARREYVDLYIQGGWTAVAATVGGFEDAAFTIRGIGRWLEQLRLRPDLAPVRSAADIERAKQDGKLGIIMHIQGTDPIEDSLDLIDAYKALGVGVMQLAYNVRNRVGDGAEEPGNAGLSRFGRKVIARLNAARVVVDCAHTGVRTSLDAIEASSRPVIISHANARAVHPVSRNAPDELLRAIARNGGVVGILGFPAMVSADARPTLDQYVAPIDHMVGLGGIDSVGIAVDFFRWQSPLVTPQAAQQMRDDMVARGLWDPEAYRHAPFHYPQGFETPDKVVNLVSSLLRRGYSGPDVRKIMGGNWMRIYRQVWDEPDPC
jgi:membrane dipeptidase